MKLRRFLFHIHIYTGLLVGLLVSLTGLTGSLLVFSHELDALLSPQLLHAHSPTERTPVVSPQTVREAMDQHRPRLEVQSILPPQTAGETYEVRLKGDGRAYVNPYTGAVLGVRSATDHPIGWLFHLHMELLSGERGKTAVGVGGLLLILLGGTGIFLWWPGKKGVRQGFTVQWRAGWKRVNFDLHRVVGAVVVLLPGLVALTGAAMVWGPQVTDWTYALTRTPPRLKVASTPQPERAALSLDRLVEAAEAALPGAVTTRITLAGKPTAPVVIRKKFARELHPNGMSFVYLDQYSGRVLHVENALQAAAGPRLLHLRYPLHIGHYGGWSVRILYVLVGLTPAFLFITGCLMWWNRYSIPRRRRRIAVTAPTTP